MHALIQCILLSTKSQLILNNEEALKFKTKAQLLYGASKIMRQQSYFLYGMHIHVSLINTLL